MPKPPRPSALEVLRHNLLILVGLPSRIWTICIYDASLYSTGPFFGHVGVDNAVHFPLGYFLWLTHQ